MRVIRMKVSTALLVDAMKMPPGMKIVGCAEMNLEDETIEMVIEHPAFEDVARYAGDKTIPLETPTVTKHEARIEWKLGEIALGDG